MLLPIAASLWRWLPGVVPGIFAVGPTYLADLKSHQSWPGGVRGADSVQSFHADQKVPINRPGRTRVVEGRRLRRSTRLAFVGAAIYMTVYLCTKHLQLWRALNATLPWGPRFNTLKELQGLPCPRRSMGPLLLNEYSKSLPGERPASIQGPPAVSGPNIITTILFIMVGWRDRRKLMIKQIAARCRTRLLHNCEGRRRHTFRDLGASHRGHSADWDDSPPASRTVVNQDAAGHSPAGSASDLQGHSQRAFWEEPLAAILLPCGAA